MGKSCCVTHGFLVPCASSWAGLIAIYIPQPFNTAAHPAQCSVHELWDLFCHHWPRFVAVPHLFNTFLRTHPSSKGLERLWGMLLTLYLSFWFSSLSICFAMIVGQPTHCWAHSWPEAPRSIIFHICSNAESHLRDCYTISLPNRMLVSPGTKTLLMVLQAQGILSLIPLLHQEIATPPSQESLHQLWQPPSTMIKFPNLIFLSFRERKH